MNNGSKSKKRLYFSINNKCNTNCDFCSMHSSPDKNTFLSFHRFKEIIDNVNVKYELQLEGGEPLMNENLYLFIEYARYSGNCNKIIISTNGILLQKHLQRLTDFVAFSGIPLLIKLSINYHLYNLNNNIFKKARDLYLATEFISNFDILFNVRLRKDDNWIIEELHKNKIFEHSNIYELQSYGRFENNTNYSKPFINQNIDSFNLYSSDGIDFKTDLIKRSNYEKTLK